MVPRKFKPVPAEVEAVEVEQPVVEGPKLSITIKRTGNGKVETITRKAPAMASLVDWVAEQID